VSRAYTLVGWAVSGSVDDGLWLVLSRFVSCHAELVTTGPVGPCCAVLSWSPITRLGRAKITIFRAGPFRLRLAGSE
jgi:hypothetical protein